MSELPFCTFIHFQCTIRDGQRRIVITHKHSQIQLAIGRGFKCDILLKPFSLNGSVNRGKKFTENSISNFQLLLEPPSHF